MYEVSYVLADELRDAYSSSFSEFSTLTNARLSAYELADAVRSGKFGPRDCVSIDISEDGTLIESVYNTLPA